MRIRGIARARQTVRWLKNRFASRALILLYHRVVELPSDLHSMQVTPQHFAEHLEVLRKYCCPVQLQHLTQALREGNLPPRAVVVTFDDGYADNFYNARPWLERHDLPATVFLTTGYLGQEREFWWDELERLLLQPRQLPGTLRLSVDESSYQWELGEAAYYSENDCRRHHCWNIRQKDDPSLRLHLYRSLYQLLHPLPGGEQQKVLDALLTWAGVEPMVRSTHCTLSPDEVIHLVEGGLIEVGAHTVTHPVLSALPAAAQRSEIQESKNRLEEILGCTVTSFAYPYGAESYYTAETVALVREAGFTCACSNFAGVVWRGTDRLQLPRVQVRDWDGDEFARRLGAWLRG